MDVEYRKLKESADLGDTTQYNQSLKRIGVHVHKILYVQLSDKNLVLDLTQDVLIKMIRSLHLFRGDCKFSTWMYQLIQNTLKNHYRQQASHEFCSIEDILHLAGSDAASPEYQAIHSERFKTIDNVLSSMPCDMRSCLSAFIRDGESYEEIAKIMDCPVGTVRSRISRAKRIISSALNEDYYEDGIRKLV